MSKGKKFVAGCCIAIGVGLVFCLIGIAMGGRVTGVNLSSRGISVYTPQGTVKGEKAVYRTGEEALEKFDSIKIEADYADIMIQPAEDYGISYQIDGRYRFSYEVKKGKLIVTQDIAPNGHIFSFGYTADANELRKAQFITIRVPKDSELSLVKIDDDYGDIVCGDFYAEKLEIDSDYGNVELGKVGSENAAIYLDYGDLEISSFSDGNMTVESDYGDIELEDITAKEVKLTADSGMISLRDVKTESLAVFDDYGDVKGKKIQAASLSGEIDSGNCGMAELDVKNVKLTSDYGDVSLELTGKLTDYSYNLQTDYGSVTLGDMDMKESYQSLEEGGNKIEIYCDSGSIEIQGAE